MQSGKTQAAGVDKSQLTAFQGGEKFDFKEFPSRSYKANMVCRREADDGRNPTRKRF